jgi:uncharacterized membrane protein SpoIIM required for sporulation
MNERDFVTQRRAAWEQLETLLQKAGKARGARALNRAELQTLGPLYRRVATDLAYARARAVSDDLVLHLNDLVSRAHALLYESGSGSARPIRAMTEFYFYEFPMLLQRHVRYFLAAFALCVGGGLFAYWLVMQNPEKISLYVPEQLKSSMEYWKSGKVDAPASAEFSAQLMTNNLTVGIISAASGVACGVPTASMMWSTGGMVGAMGALMTQVKRHDTFWPGIVPHGVAELTAIFICGTAGFVIGLALLVPGPYSRFDAIRVRGTEAIKLVLGTVPLFIFAGVIEGMFSRLPIPVAIRYGFAIGTGILWYLYLFLPRRRPSLPEAEPPRGTGNA